MEPMDLDDDNTGHSPHTFHSTTSRKRVTYPASRSASCFSPLTPPNPSRPQPHQHRHDQSSTLFSSTPAFGSPQRSALSPSKTGSASLLRSAVFGATQDSSFASPVSVRSTSRQGSPVPGLFESREGLGQVSSDEASCASMETSDRSDVSEMEVVQTSPSPPWDRVRSALSNFSLLGSKACTEQDTVKALLIAGKQNEAERKVGTAKKSGTKAASWEPSLSAVQAAASFRHAAKQRKASPSKSTVSAIQLSTPMRKLGRQVLDQGDLDNDRPTPTTRKQLRLKAILPPAAETSRSCSCGFCVKLFSLLVVSLAVVCAILMWRQAAVCNKNFAKMDAELLRNEMASKVFGQHIAMAVIPNSIDSYLDTLRAGNDSCDDKSGFHPPLALSFHGWTGVGKNFVSDIVASLFPAKTVTKFLIPYHFPHPHLDQLYQSQVETWVVSNVTKFSVSVFIFDEMDKASPGVIRGIKSAFAKLSNRNSYSCPSVFFFLSNSFGTEINQHVFQALNSGRVRESLSLEDFTHLFVDSEATWYHQLESAGVITVTVPFLPLERQHIVQCIHRDLVSKKLSTHADVVSRVLQELSFLKFPGGHQFSHTGCKRVSEKVNLVAFH